MLNGNNPVHGPIGTQSCPFLVRRRQPHLPNQALTLAVRLQALGVSDNSAISICLASLLHLYEHATLYGNRQAHVLLDNVALAPLIGSFVYSCGYSTLFNFPFS